MSCLVQQRVFIWVQKKMDSHQRQLFELELKYSPQTDDEKVRAILAVQNQEVKAYEAAKNACCCGKADPSGVEWSRKLYIKGILDE